MKSIFRRRNIIIVAIVIIVIVSICLLLSSNKEIDTGKVIEGKWYTCYQVIEGVAGIDTITFKDGVYQNGQFSDRYNIAENVIFLQGKGIFLFEINELVLEKDGDEVRLRATTKDIIYFRTEEAAKKDYEDKLQQSQQHTIVEIEDSLQGVWHGDDGIILVIDKDTGVLTKAEEKIEFRFIMISADKMRVINPSDESDITEFSIKISEKDSKESLNFGNWILYRYEADLEP